MTEKVTIRSFRPAFQDEASRLINAGLAEYFGVVDPSRNPDIRDIAEFFGRDNFYLAFLGDELVGTAALGRESPGSCRVARMTVKRAYRRRGIGTAILRHLLKVARARGYTRAVVETTQDWHGARSFYLRHGFRVVRVDDAAGEVHFERAL